MANDSPIISNCEPSNDGCLTAVSLFVLMMVVGRVGCVRGGGFVLLLTTRF